MDHQAFAQLLGNYGEFVGAIAVVATLIYLAKQIQQANIASETAAIQGFFDSWESVGDVDIPLIQVLRKGYTQPWSEISKDEQVQLNMYWANYTGKLHMGYRLHLRKVLDHPSYIGFEDFLISALRTPALKAWWGEHGEVFPADFRERIDFRIEDPNDKRPLMTEIHGMWSPD